jgi:hypothetical protein
MSLGMCVCSSPPGLYGVGVDYQEDDGGLVQKRADIIHSAAQPSLSNATSSSTSTLPVDSRAQN